MPKKIESLSIKQARKLVLLSQRVPQIKQNGNALNSTLSVIEHLGYIQIDTISAIQRAHHHTLWNRNPLYKNSHLDELMVNKNIFEYWSHAASYLPMKDYRFSLPRKSSIKKGNENHWYTRNKQLMNFVRNRIESEGPLMAKDFDNSGKFYGEWQTKPSKQALEYLFMQGELMVSCRKNFHKVYDLTERVLPKHINTSMPNMDEYARFLITRYLKANGIGQASEIVYLLKNTKALVLNTLKDMMFSKELFQIMVGENIYYVLSSSLELLNKQPSRSKLKILSPFDNLLIQRKRTKQLFGFDYLLECYVPEPKRKFGYFVLPILWNGNLVARMDCKADRKKSVLHINYLAIEKGLTIVDDFAQALCKELESFLIFNNCKIIELHKTSPDNIKQVIQNAIRHLMI